MFFQIRELKVQEEGETGVQAISFVDRPAIETDFEYFNKQEFAAEPWFKYTAAPEPETLPTSHEFCKEHAGKSYPLSVINGWSAPNTAGWVPTSNFFQQFNPVKGGPDYNGGFSFRCDNQLYGCRHKLIRVKTPVKSPFSEQSFVKIEMLSEPKREVQGLVLKSNQMIYRNDVDGSGNPGYVYFSRDTVRKLKEKYGYNRSISYMHRDDLTGQAILMDSWLEETDKETLWYVKYKIIGDKLWEQVKNQTVKGFSIEALFSIQ